MEPTKEIYPAPTHPWVTSYFPIPLETNGFGHLCGMALPRKFPSVTVEPRAQESSGREFKSKGKERQQEGGKGMRGKGAWWRKLSAVKLSSLLSSGPLFKTVCVEPFTHLELFPQPTYLSLFWSSWSHLGALGPILRDIKALFSATFSAAEKANLKAALKPTAISRDPSISIRKAH